MGIDRWCCNFGRDKFRRELAGTIWRKGNFTDIDYASAGFSFLGGALRNPWASNIGTNILDASFDINGNGTMNSIFGDKSGSKFANDMIWGVTGNYLGSKTSSPASNFMIGAGSQYGNTITDEKIE